VQRFAQLPAVRLREALQRGKPRLGNVSLIPKNEAGGPSASPPSTPGPVPTPPPKTELPPKVGAGPLNPPILRPPVVLGPKLPVAPVTSPPVVAPPFAAPPKAPKVIVPARVRLEGSNLIGAGLPKAKVNEIEVPLASAEEDFIELDLPVKAGVLTLELADGETHEIHFDASQAESDVTSDPWGQA
jgi:hypothetical protein